VYEEFLSEKSRKLREGVAPPALSSRRLAYRGQSPSFARHLCLEGNFRQALREEEGIFPACVGCNQVYVAGLIDRVRPGEKKKKKENQKQKKKKKK